MTQFGSLLGPLVDVIGGVKVSSGSMSFNLLKIFKSIDDNLLSGDPTYKKWKVRLRERW